MTTKIALVSNMSEQEQSIIANEFNVDLSFYNNRRDDLAKEGENIEVVYGNVRPFELDSLPKLKWIHATWAGIENLCYREMIEKNPIVTNIRGASADAMSEHTLAGLLYFLRDLPGHENANSHQSWKRNISSSLLKGSKVLVLGTGGIGIRLIEILKAFGCEITGVNSNGHPVSGCTTCIPLEKAKQYLSKSDHVICILPYTKQTNNLIDKSWFTLMQPHSVFINISRGKIINEKDLIKAINSQSIRGAFLDVTAQEPLPEDSPLWHQKNLFITGHRSSSPGNPASNPAFDAFKINLGHFLNGDLNKMINVIDFKKGY